jgi:hypothetical protein
MTRIGPLAALLAVVTTLTIDAAIVRAQGEADPALDAAAIFARVQQANAERATALQAYQSMRRYSVFEANHPPDAELVVSMQYTAPSTKTFKTITTQGVGWIHRRVFSGLMNAEQEATAGKDHADSAITSANYDVDFVGTDQQGGRDCYVIALLPKRRDKYLFTGTAWIDKEDFAIARLEGEPAKSPSFWVVRAPFVREYQRVDRFWLPLKDETRSQIRFAGDYVLRIQYADYQITAKH